MAAKSLPKISLIGSGKVGTSLARALHEKGYPIISIINRTGTSAIALAKIVKCKKVSTYVNDVDKTSDIILIAVSDDALQHVAEELSKVKLLQFKKLFIVHTSGVHSSDVLRSAQRKHALTASIHPIQTFPEGRKSVSLRGIYFGIEGSPDALKKAELLVNSLDAHTVTISAELKPLYHIACVFSSSYLVAVINGISGIASTLKLKASWTEVFGPLMTSAMENTIKTSAANAITGPVIRGDMSTLSLHLTTLARTAPQFLPMYSVAGIEVARIATEHGKMSRQDYQNIITLFKQFIKSYPEPKKKS